MEDVSGKLIIVTKIELSPFLSGKRDDHCDIRCLLGLTTAARNVRLFIMDATLLLNERYTVSANIFVEMVVWSLPSATLGSKHGFKYRLALVVDGCCVLRYDNEAGKGDHKHIGENEVPYDFTTPKSLLEDFWNDVNHRRF